MPYVRWGSDNDALSTFSEGEDEEEESYCDTLTEVTSLDSMSVDSELLSILRGGEEAQISDSEDIDLNDLVLMFAQKENEEEELPDYVLFMSLPPQ